MVVGIQTFGDRIVVSDVQESVHFLRYRRAENQLIIFADDTTPRWVTTTCLLDYATVASMIFLSQYFRLIIFAISDVV